MESAQYISIKDIEKKTGRTGKCNFCGECCKYEIREPTSVQNMKFLTGFGFKKKIIDGSTYAIRENHCKHLVNNKCSIWMTKNFPMACRHFPIGIDDLMYVLCCKKCGFKFPKKFVDTMSVGTIKLKDYGNGN